MAISLDCADPAQQSLALQGGMAQPVTVRAAQRDLGVGLAGAL
jgi:hypothetical protein